MTANQSMPIYTIGHANRGVAELIELLREHQIDFLIDIRTAAEAERSADFAPPALTTTLQGANIRYVSMNHALAEGTVTATGSVDYAVARTTTAYQQAIGRLQKAFQQQHHVALLGVAAAPEDCPRSHLFGASLQELAIPVVHLDQHGVAQTQEAVMWDWANQALESTTFPEEEGIDPYYEEIYAEAQRVTTPVTLPTYADPHDVLKRVYGYEHFRPQQEKIIANVLNRRDTLVIMPTGGGKSICYQLPALLMAGLTLVVSPLIALMQDQVAQLRTAGVAAAFLNSSLSAAAYNATVMDAKAGNLKLLYVAPETLARPDTLALLAQCKLEAIAIDEAHCISQWGHDFRPEYRQIVAARQRFPAAVCLALTATATPRVQEDIKQSLGFRDENEFLSSFDRPNLFISVQPKSNVAMQVIDFLRAHPDQSGIIYCSTQRHVNDLAATINANGLSALPYHAGLDGDTRTRNQHAFMVDDTRVIVATIAFGMGVDKPDVRFVLHVDLPQDVEGYYQQIGRAGRDGERADCLLLFGYGDVQTIQYFIQQGAESELPGRQHRLQTMVNWAETTACRRRDLLGYFGEEIATENCGMCDNCLQPAVELVDLTIPAQKFLSCVLRTDERFGAGHIIGILRGSKARNILKWKHDQLPTYGIGQEYSDATWKYLAQQFIQRGLLARSMDTGSLTVTEAGRAILRGEKFEGTLQEVRYQSSGSSAQSLSYEITLFEQLRQARKALADADNLPPYMIFSDRSLQEMATYLPQSVASFGMIHGVGRAKVERFADDFLPIIESYCAEKNLAERPKVDAPTVVRVSATKSRSDEVGELFHAGHSLDDLASQYQVKRQTVINNLAKYAEAGKRVDAEQLRAQSTLPAPQQADVLAAFDEHGDSALRPIFDAMNGQISYDELHLLRLVYRLASAA